MPTDNYNNRSVVVRVPDFGIARGQDGLSAYEQAVLGGYTGTEAQFNQELSSFKTLHDETVTNATAAAASASSAGQSATAAAGSAENAASSASSSASSASAASASAGSAADSASNAASSAASAASSAASADSSASTATQKASEAGSSATAASGSATAAAASADSAASSAAAAAASAAAIEEYEHDAEAWAIGKRGGQDVPSTDATYHNNSKYYADQAGTSASTAASSASAASASESNAAASASSAAGSASSATTSAATATEKAGEASTSASEASTSAASAAGSATNAASSATAASASATAAGNAQTAAETAQGKAEDAQEAAETAAQSVSESAEQIATNTQDISDLKSATETVNNDLSKKFYEYGFINLNNEWSIGQTLAPLESNRSVIIQVTPGDSYVFQRNATSIACVIAFLVSLPASWEPGTDMSNNYATGGRRTLPEAKVKGIVPSDAKYLIATELVNNADWSLSTFVIGEYDYNLPAVTNLQSSNKRIDNVENTLTWNGAVFYDNLFTLQEIYVSPEKFTPTQLSSITKGYFYKSFASEGKYIAGLILRDASNNTVVDGRLWFATKAESDAIIASGFINLPHCKYCFDASRATDGVARSISSITITTKAFDLAKNTNILDRVIVDLHSAVEGIISPTTFSGYINSAGVITPSNNYLRTANILMHTGDMIRAYENAGSAAPICEVIGDTYKPLMTSAVSGNHLYVYTADHEMYVCCSYASLNDAEISILPYEILQITPQITWNLGQFVTLTGGITGSGNANYGISKPIRVYQGDEIQLTISATANTVAVISTSDATGKVLHPCVATASDAYTNYTYIVEESGYIVFSGNTATINPPTATIKRNIRIAEIYDKWSVGFGNEQEIRESYHYNDTMKAIPENYNSILCYHADNKKSGDHINNAVVYPDGTIIACRAGGDVVKIEPNGTETILMTIANAWDWRGMFMDSNFNVYVSPHNTLSKNLLTMTNRGLYRLAYGESQFTKVISLYNTASSVYTETQENDDTIWTMCEDNKGRLYAGVYAHSTRENPSIYRSDDGGENWSMVCNLLTEGYTATSWLGAPMHIHDIIFNPYNKALYCLVGEVNTIYKSTDNGESWIDLNVPVQNAKGTTLIAVPDGILIGSDGTTQGVISKLYSDDKTVRTVGEMWHAEFFGMRQSDLTGWIYAFTKIESGINDSAKYPPIAANTDASALATWESGASGGNLKSWQLYNAWVDEYYTHDSIHPVNAAIIVSKDYGETWEIIYKEDTGSANGIGMGIFCVGYFRNGECLCGIGLEKNGGKTFGNPIVVREGKYMWNSGKIDLSGDAFIVTNNSTVID